MEIFFTFATPQENLVQSNLSAAPFQHISKIADGTPLASEPKGGSPFLDRCWLYWQEVQESLQPFAACQGSNFTLNPAISRLRHIWIENRKSI
jgi:hypothetical protein